MSKPSTSSRALEDVTALDTEGRVVRFGDLWQDQAAVLVFVRHFG